MSTFSHQFATASPVLTMPPHVSQQSLPAMPTLANSAEQPMAFDASAVKSSFIATTSPAPAPSRKRSRDEASINLEPDLSIMPAPAEVEDNWTYGEGMVLIKPDAGYVADASSQSGTWLEEKKAEDEAALLRQQEEFSVLRNAKSQRVECGSDLALPTPSSCGDSPLASAGSNTIGTIAEPVVDDFTLHLGIGWRRISDEEHIQAAARGWGRYIDNHYPLTNAHVVLESKGLQSYLVEANKGFFLLSEDLRQARLVSTTVEGMLENLQCSPPKFDGEDTMFSAETPRLTGSPRDDALTPGDMDTNMG